MKYAVIAGLLLLAGCAYLDRDTFENDLYRLTCLLPSQHQDSALMCATN